MPDVSVAPSTMEAAALVVFNFGLRSWFDTSATEAKDPMSSAVLNGHMLDVRQVPRNCAELLASAT